MKRILWLILILTLITSQSFAGPPMYTVPTPTGGVGNVTETSENTTDNALICTDGSSGRLIQQCNATSILDNDLDMTGTGGNQAMFPQNNDVNNPTICFEGTDSTCNTGFQETNNNVIGVITNGTQNFAYAGASFQGANANGAALINSAASSTVPTLRPDRANTSDGLGSAGAGRPVIIGGAVPLQVWGTTVTLTSAQMLALAGVPVTVVAAQGAGTIIEFVKALIIYDDATDYAAGTEEEMVIEYEDGDDASKEGEADGFIDGNADAAILLEPVNQANPATEDFVDNANDALQILNTGGTRAIEANTTVCDDDGTSDCSGGGCMEINTTAAHGLEVSQPIVLTDGTGTVCNSITAGTTYFVTSVVDANNVLVSATQGGAAIAWTEDGTAFDSDAWEDWDTGTGTLTIKITYRVYSTGL